MMLWIFALCGFALAAVPPNDYAHCLQKHELNVTNAKVQNDPKFKQVHFCLNKREGIQFENGSFAREAIRRKVFGLVPVEKVVKAVLRDCAQEKETPEESALFYNTCLNKIILHYEDVK